MILKNHGGGVSVLVLAVAALAATPLVASAGSNSTTLPNGAALEVSIDDPVTCTEFVIPTGEATIDVGVLGGASIGLGEPDATFVYVIDVSGSTASGSGTGCSPILNCEKQFFVALNNAVAADGSADEAGVVAYESNAWIALGLTDPADPTVNATINGLGTGNMTNCTDALWRAYDLIVSSSNGTKSVVFASDGLCNYGGSIGPAVSALIATGARVDSVAIGSGSNCTSGSTGTLNQIAVNGGQCWVVPDPGNLPDIIANLIGSTLESLALNIDGAGNNVIPNAEISLPLPQPGAVSVSYNTTAAGLGTGDHDLCVTAYGSDVTGGTGEIPQCETIHLLQLQYGGSTVVNAVNDLNFVTDHTVTVEIVGGVGPDRDVFFEVGGWNAAVAVPPNAVVSTPVNTPASFTYAVPQDCASLGTDTITATTTIAEEQVTLEFTKEWIDTIPPEVSCDPTVNPHGGKVPPAGNTNPDGFYQLNAADPNIANCPVLLTVVDGDGYVFPGPFDPGDKIKYTQDDDVLQVQKKMGGSNGAAGAIRWHLIGHGDLTVIGTDPSGNDASAVCLVPQPPR